MTTSQEKDSFHTKNIDELQQSYETIKTGFQHSYLKNELFVHILSGINSNAKLVNWSTFKVDFSSGFVANALSDKTSPGRVIGHSAFKLTYCIPDDDTFYEKIVVLKSKARGHEVAFWLSSLIPNLTPEIQAAWDQIIDLSGFPKGDHKELEIAKIKDPIFSSVIPDIYWAWKDEENDIFVFAMEYLDRKDCVHTPTLSGWIDNEVGDILHGLAVFHGRYFGCTPNLNFSDEKFSKSSLLHQVPAWTLILQEVRMHCSEVITEEMYEIGMAIVSSMSKICEFLEAYPKSLIHNDLWPQNFCYRRNVPELKQKLCFFDWELAGFGPPQMDAVLLINLIHSDTDCRIFIMKYRDYLQRKVERNNPSLLHHLETEKFLGVYDICAMLVLVRVMTFYVMTGRTVRNFFILGPFLAKLSRYVKSIKQKYAFF